MIYRETLRPPLAYIAVTALLAASFGLIVLRLSVGLAAAIAVVLGGAVVIALLALSPRIVVDDDRLYAGGAQIEGMHLGEITTLDRDQTRAAFGPEADTRAWSLYRSYARAAVRVAIIDPRDPTPYWLICTNNPAGLARSLNELASQRSGS